MERLQLEDYIYDNVVLLTYNPGKMQAIVALGAGTVSKKVYGDVRIEPLQRILDCTLRKLMVLFL